MRWTELDKCDQREAKRIRDRALFKMGDDYISVTQIAKWWYQIHDYLDGMMTRDAFIRETGWVPVKKD